MKTKSISIDVVPVFILPAEILSPGSVQNGADFSKRYGRITTFKDVRTFVPGDAPTYRDISKSVNHRLFVVLILPEEITSVVYLYSDAVVVRSFREPFM